MQLALYCTHIVQNIEICTAKGKENDYHQHHHTYVSRTTISIVEIWADYQKLDGQASRRNAYVRQSMHRIGLNVEKVGQEHESWLRTLHG